MRLRIDHYHHYYYHWGKNENKCFVLATFLYLESYLRNKASLNYNRSVAPGCLSIIRIHGGNAASYRICDVSATYFWLSAWSTSRNDSSISKEPPSYDSMSWSMDLGYLHLFRLCTECERAYVVTRCSLCPLPTLSPCYKSPTSKPRGRRQTGSFLQGVCSLISTESVKNSIQRSENSPWLQKIRNSCLFRSFARGFLRLPLKLTA